MQYSIKPIVKDDRIAIMDIYNYYIENSFAAYPENVFPYEAFDMFLKMINDYPSGTIRGNDEKIIGFGMLRAHNPIPSFSHTAEVTYFIHHEHTRKGLGKRLLDFLEAEGRNKGITIILANISSLNPGSINFHNMNGFVECGHFKSVCRKKGQLFDTLWMQKTL